MVKSEPVPQVGTDNGDEMQNNFMAIADFTN